MGPLWGGFSSHMDWSRSNPSPPSCKFVFAWFQSLLTLARAPSHGDVCSFPCIDTCLSSKTPPFASRGIKGTPSLHFSSPFFELLLCYSKFLPSSCCLPYYIHSSFSWGFGATSCPIFSYYWMNKESFGGYLGSLRLVKWSWSHEVILFFAHCIVLYASIPWQISLLG